MQTASQFFIEQHELPRELCVKPLALVGISGLDTLNNAVHKLVWEAFCNSRRLDRAPVQFKLIGKVLFLLQRIAFLLLFNIIGNAHEFPVIKPKRNSYDWYHPKGILKKNWMNKYLNEVPAVMVIFYDLDWNDSQWSEKMIECASRVQSMRYENFRIYTVFVQM